MAVRKLACLCAIASLLAGAAWAVDKPADRAQAAAQAWLQLVDDGKYEESWRQAASGARAPLGKLVSRKVKSRAYSEKLPGAPDGKYVVIQFDTVFAAKSSAIETVTPMLDPDGVWRVAGYYIR